ncbi:Poly polymerase catalytic domain containing protein, partial [Globisporangium splendens]
MFGAKPKPKSAARTVDPLAGCSFFASIYEDENGILWNAMLNFTDISYGSFGNNKFYSVQLIHDPSFGPNYKVFRKWGRVGAASPQKSIEFFGGCLERAKQSFQKRVLEKSGNKWPLEGPFEKKKGKYVLVVRLFAANCSELADEEPETEMDVDSKAGASANVVPSELPEKVQDVIKLICDPSLIAKEVSEMNVDLKKLPLGRLSKAQISQGYTILQRLSNALTAIDELENPPAPAVPTPAATTTTGRTTRSRKNATAKAAAVTASTVPAKRKRMSATDATRVRNLKADLKALSSEFYSLIPHDFGRSLPPVINTMDEVKVKISLLEVLADLELSQKLQQEEKKSQASGSTIHPLDAQYKMLNTKMEPLEPTDEEFKRIERYVESTEVPSSQSYKLKIQSVMKIARGPEEETNETFKSVDNHKLLWHGSRLSNVVGILSQGLRIAPPEAPKNGYLFGKGVYFADAVTKSAAYCFASPARSKAVLLLAEAALGKSYEAPHPTYLDYRTVNAHGCESTHGLGRMAPNEGTYETMSDGVVVPIGKIVPMHDSADRLYNEFIVYRTEQIKLRTLLKVNVAHGTATGGVPPPSIPSLLFPRYTRAAGSMGEHARAHGDDAALAPRVSTHTAMTTADERASGHQRSHSSNSKSRAHRVASNLDDARALPLLPAPASSSMTPSPMVRKSGHSSNSKQHARSYQQSSHRGASSGGGSSSSASPRGVGLESNPPPAPGSTAFAMALANIPTPGDADAENESAEVVVADDNRRNTATMLSDSQWEREIAEFGRILDDMLTRVTCRDLVKKTAEYMKAFPQHSIRFQLKIKQRAFCESARQFQAKLMLFYVLHEFLKSFQGDELLNIQRQWFQTVDDILHACARDMRNFEDGRKRIFKTLARWEELKLYSQKIKGWKSLIMGETKPRRGPMRLPRSEAERLAEVPDQLQQFPPPLSSHQIQINRSTYPYLFERSDFVTKFELKQHWRYTAVAFIDVLSQCLMLSRDVSLTASMFFHRVFERGIYAKERFKFAAACIFLSAKAASKRMKLLRMVRTMHEILEQPLMVGDEELLDLERMQLLYYEIEVLQGINFDLTTEMPFYYLRRTLDQMPDKFRRDVMNDSHTVLEDLLAAEDYMGEGIRIPVYRRTRVEGHRHSETTGETMTEEAKSKKRIETTSTMIAVATEMDREVAEVVETSDQRPRDTTMIRNEDENVRLLATVVESAHLGEMTVSIGIGIEIMTKIATTRAEITTALIEATALAHALPTHRQGSAGGKRVETAARVAVGLQVAVTVEIVRPAIILEEIKRAPPRHATGMKAEATGNRPVAAVQT